MEYLRTEFYLYNYTAIVFHFLLYTNLLIVCELYCLQDVFDTEYFNAAFGSRRDPSTRNPVLASKIEIMYEEYYIRLFYEVGNHFSAVVEKLNSF